MTFVHIREELDDIKRELDRLEKRGSSQKDIAPLRESIAAIEKHLGIEKQIAA